MSEVKSMTIEKTKGKAFNQYMILGGFLALVILAALLLGPYLTPFDPNEMSVPNRLAAPSGSHWFGTDEFGRDLLSRIVYGGRVSLLVGFFVALISAVLGTILGLYAGYYKWLDPIVMKLCDGLSAIPSILLAITLMAALGASVTNIIIVLSIVYTPSVARIARGSVLQVKNLAFVEALKNQGASTFRVLFLNILPNILSPIIVQTFHIFAMAILSEASLSFLGVGIAPPTPSLGGILQASKLYISKAWWLVVFPGATIVGLVFSFNIFGDGLRDYFDPQAKIVRRSRRPAKQKNQRKVG